MRSFYSDFRQVLLSLQWFRSYLFCHIQYVRRGVTRSTVSRLACGVPQGSVIGPVLFILHTADLVSLVTRSGLSPHLYSDDTQIFGACFLSTTDAFLSTIHECVSVVVNWIHSTVCNWVRIRPNSCGAQLVEANIVYLLQAPPSAIGSCTVVPSSRVRDLGVYIDKCKKTYQFKTPCKDDMITLDN